MAEPRRLPQNEKPPGFKLWRIITCDSKFLRRHYPDQVLRSAAFRPPSQPGITKLPPERYSILWRENITVGMGGQAGVPWVTVQGCGGGVIASAARQSRWGNRFLRDRRGCYGVEIATAQAPRNDNLLNSEQLLPWARAYPVCGRETSESGFSRFTDCRD